MLVRTCQWPWFAIQARTCREKLTKLFLENRGFECFLPLAKANHRWSDRVKQFELPLFPGYLFCRMNPYDRLPVLQAPGVIQIVGVGKNPLAVPEEEIEAIQQATASGLATMPWPYLQVGSLARIEGGPLQGLTGIIVKIKSGMKLILSVNLLQRSVAVEIDREWISVLPPAKTHASTTAASNVH